MDVYRFVNDLPQFENAVLTIGTFDGVHVGHQKIIAKIKELAGQVNGKTVLLTFHPHPRLVLHPEETSLKLINTLDEKIHLLDRYGIDYLLIASFTEGFSQTDPEAYVRDFLVKKINPRIIAIGYDHHFGKDRKGNIEVLKELSVKYGFEVVEIPKQLVEDIAVSSTKVRQAILNGEIKKANELLGHHFSFEGQVIRGKGIGNELGYPTANIFVDDKNYILPAAGVYAALAEAEGQQLEGMLYIGNRPTFSGEELGIEINIFDWHGSLYGKKVKVEVVAEVRGDEKFDNAAQLQAQIAKDKEAVMAILAEEKAN